MSSVFKPLCDLYCPYFWFIQEGIYGPSILDVNGSPLFVRFSITTMPSAALIKCLLNERVYNESSVFFISNVNSMRYFTKKGLLELKILLICRIRPKS